jgi:hypothetical protein
MLLKNIDGASWHSEVPNLNLTICITGYRKQVWEIRVKLSDAEAILCCLEIKN